ncbi:hypothetical protein AVEN_228780-1 [Araneus ventricosus]|uniref:Helitron helicase-like domain-containing protein n=1 Tax=Araneus ventricosus TaxID=182803 RepID=A0A4Y2TES7_ARAVE|nr:hypothetical protein AVEN_228780-1 [Araneus ventricosus]
MIHGPCGTLNPNLPCMREGVCTKQYPKEFREKTEENINGYLMYQGKCTESVRVSRYGLDNRWVVPYNPWLSKKFNAPINIESHTVVRLAVHLPDQQAIVYQDGQEEEAVARAATRQTTLTAWFELNKNDQDSHNYLYRDVPHYYTFNKSAMKWQKRQRGGEQVIGRMPVVNIQDSERYYLRLLLLRKLGAVSFNDLKTVDGIVCNTFQQACKIQGLLAGDQHWYDTLNEAIQTRAPFQLPSLFSTICGFGEVNYIPELWFRYKDALSEGFVRQYFEDSGPQYALAEIEEFLNSKHITTHCKERIFIRFSGMHYSTRIRHRVRLPLIARGRIGKTCRSCRQNVRVGQLSCRQSVLVGKDRGSRWPSGKVSAPIPLKICRILGLLHAKSYVGVKCPPDDVVRKLGEEVASSGVVLVV